MITPSVLKGVFDQYVVGQDAAKIAMATSFYKHSLRMRSQIEIDPLVTDMKPNLLLIGPTASGKTSLAKIGAKILGLPYVIVDATKYTGSGWVGKDVENIIDDLLKKAKGDIELTQRGLVFIDEVDKIAYREGLDGDHNTGEVQNGLLTIVEGTEVDLNQSWASRTDKVIDTTNILFMFGGAFEGLDEILGVKGRIGFGSEDESFEGISEKMTDALKEYGIGRQLLGRISTIALLDELNAEQLEEVLRMDKSAPRLTRVNDFRRAEVELRFEDAAYPLIAERAAAIKQGVRGLNGALEQVLGRAEHVLPDYDIDELVVTPAMVRNPDEALDKILETATRRPGENTADLIISTITRRTEERQPLYMLSDETTYIRQLGMVGVAKSHREAAAFYGRNRGKDPFQVKKHIEEVRDVIIGYELMYREKTRVPFSIRRSARNILIGEIITQESSPKKYLEERLGEYLSSLDARAVNEDVTLSAGDLTDLPAFLKRVTAPKH